MLARGILLIQLFSSPQVIEPKTEILKYPSITQRASNIIPSIFMGHVNNKSNTNFDTNIQSCSDEIYTLEHSGIFWIILEYSGIPIFVRSYV